MQRTRRSRGEGYTEYVVVLSLIMVCSVVAVITAGARFLKSEATQRALCIECDHEVKLDEDQPLPPGGDDDAPGGDEDASGGDDGPGGGGDSLASNDDYGRSWSEFFSLFYSGGNPWFSSWLSSWFA